MSGIAGRCSCGSVQLSLLPPLPELHICHCSQCRQSNGSAFNLALIVQSNQVDWLKRETLHEFESSPGKWRSFCRACGSPAYSRRDAFPAILRLRAGLFPNLPRPQVLTQGYRESSWPWADELFGLTVSEQSPPDDPPSNPLPIDPISPRHPQ